MNCGTLPPKRGGRQAQARVGLRGGVSLGTLRPFPILLPGRRNPTPSLQTLVRSMPEPMRGSPSSSISSAGGGPRAHPQAPPQPDPPNPVIASERLSQSPPPGPGKRRKETPPPASHSAPSREPAHSHGILGMVVPAPDCDVEQGGVGWSKAVA